VTTYAYNALGQTTDLANRTSAGALVSEFATPSQGGYDGAGNRTALAANIPGAPVQFSGSTAYTYDAKGQLTGEQSQRGTGNATTFRGASRTFNANNQHTANTYDGNGNPTTYGGSSCAFDPENRATAFASALTAGYTGDGLRAWKQGTGGKTYFLYDGGAPVVEMNSSGNVSAVNTFGANGLLSRTVRQNPDGSAVALYPTWYTFDPSGNVAQRLGFLGASSSDLYDAFGARQSTSSTPDVFGFGGQWGGYTDAETGLVLCAHRYYDPQAGRFVTRDPMGYGGGVNLYGYAANNAVSGADPSGFDATGVLDPPVLLPEPEPVTPSGGLKPGPLPIIIIIGGVEAGWELWNYRPCHSSGIFTGIGEWLGNHLGSPCPEEEPAPQPVRVAPRTTPNCNIGPCIVTEEINIGGGEKMCVYVCKGGTGISVVPFEDECPPLPEYEDPPEGIGH